MVRPNLWFMYDCHVFEKIDTTSRDKAALQIRACFNRDGCGGLFPRWPDGSTDEPKPMQETPLPEYLHANWKVHGYHVLNSEISDFLDKFYAVPEQPADRRVSRSRP